MSARRLVQISTGLGAGNIGDELMARAFWEQLPEEVQLEVEMFPEYFQQREPYPERHRYFLTDWEGATTVPAGLAGLLAGGTPVADWQGLHFPLEFIARRLRRFVEAGLPVDALGVGVDRLESAAGREIFARYFLPIRSWTVRTERCRQALLELGVAEEQVAVGADWAWLYRPRRDLREWGAAVWRELGVEAGRPLVVVNVVHEKWAGREDLPGELARALDELVQRHGFQAAFFCNEMREGEYFDRAAAERVRARMHTQAALAPNYYYGPDEALGLVAHATVTISERYHFTVESVLAGTAPVAIVRGQKMEGLVEELGLEPAGSMEQLEAQGLVAAVLRAAEEREALTARLLAAGQRLARRAERNLALWRTGGCGS
jgi:polysaccharide pyruvyl transferase WcaK-like protein